MTNERRDPVLDGSALYPHDEPALHLHEATGRGNMGENAPGARDPTGMILNSSGFTFGDINNGPLSSSNMFDYKQELQTKLELLFNTNNNVDQSQQITVINQMLPDWFQLSDDGSGTHGVSILATLLNLLLTGLPTSDPGGGLVWLSAS